jgi:uncharacterized repeat protein (TIGR02543 family)
MKNNFITKIIGATLAFAMMIGGAVGINAAKEAKEVNAADGFVSKSAATLAAENEWVQSAGSSIGTKFTSFALDDYITVSFVGTGNTATYWTDVRVYGTKSKSDASVTFTGASGVTIKTITLTFSTQKSPTFTPSIVTGEALTVNANSKTITMNGTSTGNPQIRITNFECEYEYTPARTLSSIALSGTYPTSFEQGDAFSHEGMTVTATYSDASTADVTSSATFTGYDMSTAGDQTVTVSYTESGTTKTATYDINVAAATMYTVGGTIANGSLSSTDSVREGNPLNINIVAAEKCTLPVALALVTMGGNTLIAGSDYTYNSETGAFSIASVTGNVVINAACEKTTGYWADKPFTVAQAKAAIDSLSTINDAYVSGIISQIDSYNSNYKSITYWISDDGLKTSQLEVYSGKGIDGADFSSESDIELGAAVVITGQLKKFGSTYEFNFDNQQVSYTPIVRHNVTFVSNGGSTVASQLIADGGTAVRPTDPTKSSDETYNYSFAGWFANDQLSGQEYDFNTPVTDDLTLYAKWTASLIPAKDVIESTLATKSSLTYRYSKTGDGVVDVLNRANTYEVSGESGTGYKNWTNDNFSSDVTYKGFTCGDNSSVQLRVKGSTEGIVTTTNTNNRDVKKISVVWESHTQQDKSIKVFGKNTPYQTAADLFSENEETTGSLLGTLTYSNGAPTSIVVDGSYKYIGIRANDSAAFLTSISIQWGDLPTYNYSNVGIRFTGSISTTLWERLDNESTIEGYGIMYATEAYLSGVSIKGYYDLARADESSVDDTFTAVQGKSYKMVKGLEIKSFYTEITNERAHPAQVGDEYGWNLFKNISNEELATPFTAVAYIRTTADEIIFLDEITKSAAQLAQDLIDADNEYDEASLEGSLADLASKA